jgi:hypothetical protein
VLLDPLPLPVTITFVPARKLLIEGAVMYKSLIPPCTPGVGVAGIKLFCINARNNALAPGLPETLTSVKTNGVLLLIRSLLTVSGSWSGKVRVPFGVMVSCVTGTVLGLLTVERNKLMVVPAGNPAAETVMIVPGAPTTGDRPKVGVLKLVCATLGVGTGSDAPKLQARAANINSSKMGDRNKSRAEQLTIATSCGIMPVERSAVSQLLSKLIKQGTM